MNEEKSDGTERKQPDKESKADAPGAEREKNDEIPENVTLPPASFTSLVILLSTNALGYMAELEKAETRKKRLLRMLARHTIDTIRVLDEKTKGNLERDEKDMIDHVLADLQLQYIKFSEGE